MKRILLTLALTSLIVVTLAVSPAHAIIIRHDVDDAEYIVDEADFPAVFPLAIYEGAKSCAPTLIAPEWAVTAAHCLVVTDVNANPQGHPVTIAGQEYFVSEFYIHPEFGLTYDNLLELSRLATSGDEAVLTEAQERLIDDVDLGYDIALLKFAQPVENVAPIPLYQGEEFIGQEIEMVGWGLFGTGDAGIYRDRPVYDGNLRLAQNRISYFTDTYLVMDFDTPASEDVMPLEGVPAPNDSGCPAFVTVDGQRYVIAVSSGGHYGDPLALPDPEEAEGRYGWHDQFVRISAVRDWIDTVMGQS